MRSHQHAKLTFSPSVLTSTLSAYPSQAFSAGSTPKVDDEMTNNFLARVEESYRSRIREQLVKNVSSAVQKRKEGNARSRLAVLQRRAAEMKAELARMGGDTTAQPTLFYLPTPKVR